MIASFVDHFEENHENLISGSFQFDIPKLRQEMCFIFYLLYQTMYMAYEKRKATSYFFRRAF